jgi:hypothetical protein
VQTADNIVSWKFETEIYKPATGNSQTCNIRTTMKELLSLQIE